MLFFDIYAARHSASVHAATRVDNHGIRYYDPEVGRYISRDPVGYKDGMNVYLYVSDNPINHIDPLGLWETGSYSGDVGEVFKGYGDAIANTAKGLYNLGRHPVQSAVGIEHALTNPGQTWNAIKEDYSSKAGTLRGQGEIIGEVLGTVATMGAGAEIKGVSKASEITGIANKTEHIAVQGEKAVTTAEKAAAASEGAAEGSASQSMGETATVEAKGVAAKSTSKGVQLVEDIVGSNAKATLNEAGDLVIESETGLTKVRFDINKTTPHQNPHAHVESFKQVKNNMIPVQKSGPIYPRDVPNE